MKVADFQQAPPSGNINRCAIGVFMVKHMHFNSTLAYYQWAKVNIKKPWSGGWGGREPDKLFAGINSLTEGNSKFNSLIEKYINEVSSHVPSLKREWVTQVAGAFPNVPAYLSNDPENMYYMQTEQSDRTPIRIWVGVTSSAGIGEAELAKRGAVLTAFASVLAEIRSVYLTPFTCNSGSNTALLTSWDVTTSPMVLSEIAASLADPNVTRYLGLEVGHQIDPNSYYGGAVEVNWDAKQTKANLPIGPDDLFLSGISLYDELLTNPIKWVKTNLEKYIEELD